jgi:hypothetical protein
MRKYVLYYRRITLRYRNYAKVFIVTALPMSQHGKCNGHGHKDVRGLWGKWGHHEYRGRRGARPAWRGKK